jgi:hypothetical protein
MTHAEQLINRIPNKDLNDIEDLLERNSSLIKKDWDNIGSSIRVVKFIDNSTLTFYVCNYEVIANENVETIKEHIAYIKSRKPTGKAYSLNKEYTDAEYDLYF